MTKKKTKPAVRQYRVLVACRNNDTGKSYWPGETVTADDFPQEIINNWLLLDPPVLGVATDGTV